MSENTIEANGQMLEVTIKQPDDFLKVRETLTRIQVASRKDKTLFSLVIYYINKENILLHISRGICFRW